MTDKKEHIKHSMKSTAPADCVTEIRIGNSVLVVSGKEAFFTFCRYTRRPAMWYNRSTE